MPVLILVVLAAIIMFLYWQNNSVVISQYIYSSSKVASSFDEFKILHISDFHNKKFGKDEKYLIEKIEASKPNIIVVTGDIIDRRRYDLKTALTLVKAIVKIAPVYYVTGNHEIWSGNYDEIKSNLEKEGVICLENEAVEYRVGRDEIYIFGVLENTKARGGLSEESAQNLEIYSSNLKEENLSILLSHRPELFPLYQKYKFNMVFSGHAHGGQIRIPLFGAMFAPDQGLFPKYSGGKYEENNMTMFLSRGLGNSIFPIRLFNKPELISIELKSLSNDR